MTSMDDDCKLQQVARSTIGFLKTLNHEDGSKSLIECGSGVLAEVNGIKGVVTAAHVIQELQRYQSGAVFPALPHRAYKRPFEFALSDCQCILVGGEDEGPEGPDFGFVRLPFEVEQRLTDNWMFYNFDSRLNLIVGGAEQKPLSDYVAAGVVAEKTEESARTSATVTKTFTIALGYGDFFNERKGAEGYDVFDLQIGHNENLTRPTSYGGMSGSGVWAMGETDAPLDRMLMGIVFYETEPNHLGERTLICHGSSTIYRSLLSRVVQELKR